MVWLLYSAIAVINSFIAITIIYNVSAGISGWSYYQMLLLAASTNIVMGVSAIFASNGGWAIITKMRSGGIDPYLVRPYTTLAVMLSNFGDVEQLSAVAGGLIMFAYAALNLRISLASFLIFAVLFSLGLSVFVMFTMMITIVVYYIFKSGHFLFELNDIISNAGRYPLKVYPLLGQVVFSLLLPIGIASYYPSAAMLSEASPVGVAEVAIVSVLLFWISHRLFYSLMKKYTSGGG